MHFIRTIKSEKEYNLNGEMWYVSDIINAIKEDIQNIIDENTLPVEIEDIEIESENIDEVIVKLYEEYNI